MSDFKNKSVIKIGESELKSGLSPDDIHIDIENSDTFWTQYGENLKRYKDLVLNYQKAQNVLKEKGSLGHLSLTDPISMAYQVFHGNEPITLIKYNGKYVFDSSGRHRVIAAKILKQQGYDIQLTAMVTEYSQKNETKSSNFSNTSNIGNMSLGYEIERQVELLGEAKATFVSHSQQLENLLSTFNSALKSFEMDNLNHDYQEFLEEFNSEYSGKLKKMRDVIDSEYIPAIQRKINYLEDRE